jgi:hypothetical protein
VNEWLTNHVDSTLRVPLQSRWREFVTNSRVPVSGVVSGLVVGCIPESLKITVSAGHGIVAGTQCYLEADIELSVSDLVSDGVAHYVCLRQITETETGADAFGTAVWVRRYTDFEVVVLTASEYSPATASLQDGTPATVLCIGRVVWEVTDTEVVVNGVAYPMRVRAVGSSLSEFDTSAYRDAARIGDVVAVMEPIVPVALNEIAVRLYSLGNRTDPVLVTVTIPGVGRRQVSGLWVQNPNSASQKPWTVACLVDGVTYYPADADIPDTRKWVEIRRAGAEMVSYLTSMPRFSATVISYESHDATEFVADIATPVSAADHKHRNATGSATVVSAGNPHRLSLNDVGVNETTPLLRSMFDTGFSVHRESVTGVVGDLVTEHTEGCNVRVDWFGSRTQVIGAKYIVTEHSIRSVAYVVNASTGASIAHRVSGGVIVLTDTITAGSFAGYVEFVPNLPYSAGDMVAVTVAGTASGSENRRRLYRCRAFYNPIQSHAGEPGPAFVNPDGSLSGGGAILFEEMIRVPGIVVGYYAVLDNEYVSDPVGTSSVRFRPNTTYAVVSQGRVIDPDPERSLSQVSLYALSGLSVSDLSISLDKDYSFQLSTSVCDRTKLADRTSSKWTASGYGTGNAVPVFSTSRQVKVTALHTGLENLYLPPHGTCGVTKASRSAFAGNVKLLYRYGIGPATVSVLNTAGSLGLVLDSNAVPFDVTNSSLVDGNGDIVARDYWEFDAKSSRVYLSDSVYRGDSSYAFMRTAYESPRSEVIATAKGTKTIPGTSATALISVRVKAMIDVGDSVTVSCADTVTGTKFSVTRTARYPAVGSPARTLKQFDVGSTPAATATNIADSLNADPAFVDAGFVAVALTGAASQSVCYVRVIAPAGARFNTIASITTASPMNGMSVKSGFSGGADHVWTIADLVGMEVFVRDAVPVLDRNCYWSVYCTGDLDSGADPNTFYRVAYLSASTTSSGMTGTSSTGEPVVQVLKHVITADDVSGTLDTLSISDEFSVTIAVTGTDASGTEVTETVTLSRDTFSDLVTATSASNDHRWVRLQNQLVRVSSWVVVDSKGIGVSEIVIAAESGADAGSCYGLCSVNWNGSQITSIRDTRDIVNAQARSRQSSECAGEALMQASVLLSLAH